MIISAQEFAPTFAVSPSAGGKQMGLPQQAALSIGGAIQTPKCCSTSHLKKQPRIKIDINCSNKLLLNIPSRAPHSMKKPFFFPLKSWTTFPSWPYWPISLPSCPSSPDPEIFVKLYNPEDGGSRRLRAYEISSSFSCKNLLNSTKYLFYSVLFLPGPQSLTKWPHCRSGFFSSVCE